jgi:hypothetical protein
MELSAHSLPDTISDATESTLESLHLYFLDSMLKN